MIQEPLLRSLRAKEIAALQENMKFRHQLGVYVRFAFELKLEA